MVIMSQRLYCFCASIFFFINLPVQNHALHFCTTFTPLSLIIQGGVRRNVGGAGRNRPAYPNRGPPTGPPKRKRERRGEGLLCVAHAAL